MSANSAPADLARAVAAICGPGRTLHVGGGDGALVGELLARGCDAYGLAAKVATETAASWPGRFADLPIEHIDAGSYDTVVADDWLDGLKDEHVGAALEQLYRVSARFAFLAVATAPATGGEPRTRAFWESRCFAAGFRKHAAYYRVNPYAALEQDGQRVTITLEKVPAAALARFPLEALQHTRQLHMDMLRESGRRGDAHCVRYHVAAGYVRPGDTVLDLACGHGYGSHVLYQNSLATSVLGIDLGEQAITYARANYGLGDAVRFECGDAQALRSLPDDSVDFIASFETIEHLPDPETYLDELLRVLRPSGRVMLCAPNDWADETGRDPNPHHLHVYTWDRLRREVGARFLLEKGFVQTAGGAVKCHHSPRSWTEVPLAPLQHDAEWILLLGMKDPGQGAAVPYRETRYELPSDPGFHVAAFARDYDNPWLVKAMVTIGMRLESPAQLDALQTRVLRDAPADSADHGAALCGRAYAALAEPRLDPARYETLQGAIRAYAALPEPSPHRLRWQISLLYVGGELAQKRGDSALARQLFEQCASRDACRYSPLLGNRTLDALFRLAVMRVADRDLPGARALLQRSVTEARRMVSGSWLNVCGDLDQPLPFGLAELAQLLDRASRAAYALAVLESALQRPAVFAWEARGWFERVLAFKNDDLADLRRRRDALVETVAQLQAQVERLGAELVQQEARLHELGAEVVRQDDHAQSLARRLAAHETSTSRLSCWLRSVLGRRR